MWLRLCSALLGIIDMKLLDRSICLTRLLIMLLTILGRLLLLSGLMQWFLVITSLGTVKRRLMINNLGPLAVVVR